MLTRLSTDYSYLVLPKRTRDTYYVRAQPGGALIAEVVKSEGEILRLPVEPGLYEVARVTDERMFAQRLNIGVKTELTIDDTDMEERELVVAVAKRPAASTRHWLHPALWIPHRRLHGARAVYDYDLGRCR